MSYPDDLAAAQARADDAMRSLAVGREAKEDDAEHVARLERLLAESLQELTELSEQDISSDSTSGKGTRKATDVPPQKSTKGSNIIVLFAVFSPFAIAAMYYLIFVVISK
ncbi:MAG: hypothetical protein JKY56_04560 [Kofleriaceae bacterium]|nr:hypothetical protein [Kofleriaceae bacterium]